MVCMTPQVFAFCVILSALASGIVVASRRIHSFAREKLRHLLEPSRVHKPHLGHRSASRLLDRDAEGPIIVEVCCIFFFLLACVCRLYIQYVGREVCMCVCERRSAQAQRTDRTPVPSKKIEVSLRPLPACI